MSVAAIGAVGSAVGGIYSASQAGKAQENAARDANATLQQQNAQSRADNFTTMANGNAASNVLAGYLGLIDNQPIYTLKDFQKQAFNEGYGDVFGHSYPEAKKRFQQQQQRLAMQKEMQDSGQYGSLLAKFTQDDLNKDVVYNSGLQFGLDQGTQALNRQAAASGSLLSGAAAKALTRFSNDYGSTKAGEARNRFVADQDSVFNKLASTAGAGQVATQQVGAAGQNYANNVSQNQIGLGNARGASAIAQGNALSGAIGQGINAYQQNQLLNSLGRQNYSGWAGMGGFGDSYSTSYGE